VRALSRAVAQAYYDSREALGFPIGNELAKKGDVA
jgi:glycyl-tRNA synthetase alpha subunit